MNTAIFFDSNSEMIPKFHLPLNIENIGSELTKKLEEIIENEEAIIMKEFPAFVNRYANSIPEDNEIEDWVTNRAFEFNLLKYSDRYPELNSLKNKIFEQVKEYSKNLNLTETPLYIQMWFNVLRKNGRFFTKHHHTHRSRVGDPMTAYISGHICVRAENTSTYYYSPFFENECVGMPNVPGDMTLFPSWTFHSTDQNKEDTPRLTVAFDIITEAEYKKGLMDNPSNYILLEITV